MSQGLSKAEKLAWRHLTEIKNVQRTKTAMDIIATLVAPFKGEYDRENREKLIDMLADAGFLVKLFSEPAVRELLAAEGLPTLLEESLVKAIQKEAMVRLQDEYSQLRTTHQLSREVATIRESKPSRRDKT